MPKHVTLTQTTQTTAKTLWDKFIVHYGLPKKILLDKGRKFESQLVADLCMLIGTQSYKLVCTTHRSHSQCERFNSTLIGMLGMLPLEKKSVWKNHNGALVHAYNCTQNSDTGSALLPHVWRQPCFHVDVTLGLAPDSILTPTTS